MSGPSPVSSPARVLVLVALATLAAGPASAQVRGPQPLSRTQYGIGYVANAPDAMAGGAAYVLSPRWGGIGLYVDAKFDTSDPTSEKGYDPSVTSSDVANDVGGTYLKTEESWWSANVAFMRPLTPSLIAYVGGGVAKVAKFDLYDIDDASPVGLSGVVWAEDPEASETRPNFMAGFIMRLTPRVSAHFGYETQPKGLTVGATLRLPRW